MYVYVTNAQTRSLTNNFEILIFEILPKKLSDFIANFIFIYISIFRVLYYNARNTSFSN